MRDSLTERLAGEVDGVFAELVDTHGSMVLTLATRLTDMSTGEDITQEVFLRAYRALRTYPDDRVRALELRPWLATITRNLVRNEYRRRHRRATVPLDAEGTAGVGERDRAVETFDADDRLRALLSELSDDQREAVVLRHVVGLPMREVALSMACPEGTAKSHVSRGLGRLRDQLADETEPEGCEP